MPSIIGAAWLFTRENGPEMQRNPVAKIVAVGPKSDCPQGRKSPLAVAMSVCKRDPDQLHLVRVAKPAGGAWLATSATATED